MDVQQKELQVQYQYNHNGHLGDRGKGSVVERWPPLYGVRGLIRYLFFLFRGYSTFIVNSETKQKQRPTTRGRLQRFVTVCNKTQDFVSTIRQWSIKRPLSRYCFGQLRCTLVAVTDVKGRPLLLRLVNADIRRNSITLLSSTFCQEISQTKGVTQQWRIQILS